MTNMHSKVTCAICFAAFSLASILWMWITFWCDVSNDRNDDQCCDDDECGDSKCCVFFPYALLFAFMTITMGVTIDAPKNYDGTANEVDPEGADMAAGTVCFIIAWLLSMFGLTAGFCICCADDACDCDDCCDCDE